MRIVLVGGQCIPGIGGIESYMLNIAIALRASGHDVTLICSNRKAYTTYINGIKIIHKICPKSNIIALPLLFLKSIGYIISNCKTIDIINFQSIFLAFIPGWIATICRCKVHYTIHSLAEDNPKHSWLLKFMMRLFSLISIYCCGRNIITVSNTKAMEVKSRYGKKCTVIPCGVNPPLTDVKSNILDRFHINPGRYYLTIGRIDPIKNLDILIQSFIERDNPVYQLVIAGDYHNEYGNYLRNIARGNKNIIFVGSVMGDDKEFLIQNAYVNCLVSSSEGMPLSLLEAMVYGKPCIVSDIPAIREIFKEDWGLWCSVRNVNSLTVQMCTAETNYDKVFCRCPEMNKYILRNHTWDSIAERYINHI